MKTASLTSSLLVRKGAATPSAYIAPLSSFRAGPDNLRPDPAIIVTGRPQGAGPPPPPPPPHPDHNGRVRLSVRFDHAQHLRLQLAAVHTSRSMRDLIATALDRYLDEIAPQVRQGACACLGPGGG